MTLHELELNWNYVVYFLISKIMHIHTNCHKRMRIEILCNNSFFLRISKTKMNSIFYIYRKKSLRWHFLI